MISLHTLSSGSSGNALLLSKENTHILVDAGISCRRIVNSLTQLGLSLEDLSGILITHSHGDHIAGLNTMVKKRRIPIYATAETANALNCRVAGIDSR